MLQIAGPDEDEQQRDGPAYWDVHGRVDYQLTPSQSLTQHRHLTRGKDVEVRLEPGRRPPRRSPRAGALPRAVGNLPANALTATSQGWVSIVLEENRLTVSIREVEPAARDLRERPHLETRRLENDLAANTPNQ